VSATDPLRDHALLAFARILHDAVGCVWIALTAIHEGSAVGSPHFVDLRHVPPHLRTEPPPRGERDAAPFVKQYSLGSADRVVGSLELGWREAPAQAADRLIDDLLPLAALLAEDRVLRSEVAELKREVPYLRGELRAGGDLRTLTGDGPAMRAVRIAIQQVAHTASTVLVLGETGTGKELVARAIHQLSPRRDHLLVAVNCAALAPTVIASELFGHEAGSFTGATRRRIGRFELAHQGTLFLDEIAELAPEVQVMLLRVLQERTIERVGGHTPIPVDVRLIAATHQDLALVVQDGRFRADLFYRLNVFPIQVPPLRERPEDIAGLVRHFVHQFNRRLGKRVTTIEPESLRLLTAYPWPGNVRELENLVERAMIVATGDVLMIEANWLPTVPPSESVPAPAGLRDLERRSILDALHRSRGRIYGPHGAAALLGIKPTTLYGKMRRHGIPRDA
jgi:formate hydrogenlyase transcriptional activator